MEIKLSSSPTSVATAMSECCRTPHEEDTGLYDEDLAFPTNSNMETILLQAVSNRARQEECAESLEKAAAHLESVAKRFSVALDSIVGDFAAPEDNLQSSAEPSLSADDSAKLTLDLGRQTPPELRNEPVEVLIGVLVERVFDVDTIGQCFSCQVKVSLEWPCPDFENPPAPEMDDGDWEPEWTPKLRVMNLLEEILDRSDHYKTVKRNGQRMIHGNLRFLVRIAEELELQSFPTDCQDLRVSLISKMTTEQVVWKLKSVEVNAARFNLNDFRLVTECAYTKNMSRHHDGAEEYHNIVVTIKIVRKSKYYHLNISLVMFLIISAVFASWGLHPGDVGARQDVDFNLILTAVAFGVVKTDMLPKVSYMTYIDIYIYICWAFLLTVTALHCFEPYRHFTKMELSAITLAPLGFDEPREQELIDRDMLIFYVLGAVWIVVNISFFSFLWRRGVVEYKQFYENAIELQRQYDKSDNEVTRASQAFLKAQEGTPKSGSSLGLGNLSRQKS